MVIFTDPEKDNQVMAVYSHGTDSTAWTDLGYERHELDFNHDILNHSRNCYVVLDRDKKIIDVVARLNHIQPR